MKSYPLIAGSLFCEPWLMRADSHADLTRQFRELMAADDPVGPAARTRTGEQVMLHPQVEVVDGLAYLAVDGIIGRRLGTLEMMCGGFDLTNFERQMANVRDDAGIHTLLLEFDTPGGMAAGVEQAALAIRAVAEAGKRTVAYADGCCCSAGYFLASACDEILAHPDAVVGSISTICVGIDSSRQWEMQGLELKLVATGPLKALGQKGKRWTEEEMQFLRERAQVVDDVLKGFVAARRGLAAEAMNGGHWYARKAPEKLVDGLAPNAEAVVEALLLTRRGG